MTSSADKGPLVQMVSVRETRELGAERHEDAARDASRQHGVENFRETNEKRNEEPEPNRTEPEEEMSGSPGSAPHRRVSDARVAS